MTRVCKLEKFRKKFTQYWKLTKSLQTGLLLATGLAGFMSARCPVLHLPDLLALGGSLFLAISGSTMLNMWYDRDIDMIMKRTCARPLASGSVEPREALLIGLSLSASGVTWALFIYPLYGSIVLAGLLFDVAVYTLWLKRRTCWAILWGGFAGGMPVLAGRIFAVGKVDAVGIALALGVLFWIPTHIMTFSIHYLQDYQAAGIPTFPGTYGLRSTSVAIALSSIMATVAMCCAGLLIGLQWGPLGMLAVLSAGLMTLAVISMVQPSNRINFSLFKYASVYMLSAMILMVV